MGKMETMVMTVFASAMALFMFNAADQDSTFIWTFIQNFPAWATSSFIGGITTGAVAIGAVVASAFYFKNDFATYAVFVAGLLGGGITLVGIYDVIASETATLGTFAPQLAILLTAPLGLIYVFTVLAWWRGRD